MKISLIFRAALPEAAQVRYRTGAHHFRKVGLATWERTLQFDDEPKHLLMQMTSAHEEVLDIGRVFNVPRIEVTKLVGEV